MSIADIAFDRINRYIERNAYELADALWDEEAVVIRAFHRAEDDEWEVTEFDEPSEEGEWELVDEVDEDYIAEDDEVAEYLKEWREDAAEYARDPYAYYGINPNDFH